MKVGSFLSRKICMRFISKSFFYVRKPQAVRCVGTLVTTYTLDTFFRQIKSFLRFRLAFVFGLQTYYLIDFSKIYQLKGLEPKNKG